MKDKTKTYKVLAIAFAVGGFFWIIGGIVSYHYILYSFLGLLNWVIALYCLQMSKTG